MDPSKGPPSAKNEVAKTFLSPLKTTYQWLYAIFHQSSPPVSQEGVPYILSPSWISFIFSHIRAMVWNDQLVARGYSLYRDSMFKMPYFGQWVTVVGPKFVDEIARAPESSLSFQKSLNEQIQLEHLVGRELSHDHIHLALLRTLNRNLDPIYMEIADETEYAVNTELAKGKELNGWISLKGARVINDIIMRLNHRAFIGLPQCRDPSWDKAMHRDAVDLSIRAIVLRMCPESKRAAVNSFLCRFGKPFGAASPIVTQIVKERLALPEEERSNNLLSWILTRVPGEEPDPHVICGVFQLIILVAQGTTSLSFGHALFHLVAHPEYIEVLREEIKEVTEDSELTRGSLDRMHKLDSFLRETQRLSGIDNFTLARVATRDFYFSNGVRVQKGEMLQAMMAPLHHDAAAYSEPLEFRPWRFYEMALAERGHNEVRSGSKYDMVTPSNTFLVWGLGRHACPGRWYAVMLMKHLMAYLLLNYDIKLPESAKGMRPADLSIANVHIPNSGTHLLFRRRNPDQKD